MYGHFWINHDDEYPFSCDSLLELARGWLSFVSFLVFLAPAAAAAAVAGSVTAVSYVSIYLVMALPVRLMIGGNPSCFPEFFSTCECAR